MLLVKVCWWMLANDVVMVVVVLTHWHEEDVNAMLKHNLLLQAIRRVTVTSKLPIGLILMVEISAVTTLHGKWKALLYK